jgi:hypothetical protein
MKHPWERLGVVSPRALVEARLALHHAVQAVAAVGRCLAPPRADDGHTSLEWAPASRSLVSQSAPGPRPWRAALRLADMVLAVLVDGEAVQELALAGRTSSEAFAWVARQAAAAGAVVEGYHSDTPYGLPSFTVAHGGAFPAGSAAAREELARWYANADGLLRSVAGGWAGASAVRVWPHHFDIGSVLRLASGGGEEAPSIGIGLSPGDEEIAEPYFYVTPWPVPAATALPGLAVGHWHTTGWTGALLTGTEVVAAGDQGAQSVLALRFVSEAVACLRAMQRDPRA